MYYASISIFKSPIESRYETRLNLIELDFNNSLMSRVISLIEPLIEKFSREPIQDPRGWHSMKLTAILFQRGKFYPQLSYLVKVNTPRAVMAETKKAFKKLPNLEQAITALSNLKGVGTTMASALLAAASPENAPFMADECLMAIPEIEGIDYTTKEYLNFVQHIQNTVERLNKQGERS